MKIKFITKYDLVVPLDLRSLTPDNLIGKKVEDIKNMLIREGNRKVKVSDVFDVITESGDILPSKVDEIELEIEGKNLHKTRYVGYKMSGGKIVINGDAGHLVGYKMKGGKIIIKGNVGNYLGAKMKGGEIEVFGNAGSFIGAKLSGEKPGKGMKGGRIIIHGSAGSFIGDGMGGGEIYIEGTAGDLIGLNMMGGTIVVYKDVGLYPGARMRAGRIVIAGRVKDVLPSFYIDDVAPRVKVKAISFDKPFATFVGDVIVNGRGRLQISCVDNQEITKPFEELLKIRLPRDVAII